MIVQVKLALPFPSSLTSVGLTDIEEGKIQTGGRGVKERVPVACRNEDLVDMSNLCTVKCYFVHWANLEKVCT